MRIAILNRYGYYLKYHLTINQLVLNTRRDTLQIWVLPEVSTKWALNALLHYVIDPNLIKPYLRSIGLHPNPQGP